MTCSSARWCVVLALAAPSAGCGRLFYDPAARTPDAGRDASSAPLDAPLPDVWLPDAPGLDAPLPDTFVELPDAPSPDAPDAFVPGPDSGADSGALLPRCLETRSFTGAARLPFSPSDADGVTVIGPADSPIVFSAGGQLRLAAGPAAATATVLDTAGPGENPELSLDGSYLYYDRADFTGIGYATESGGRYFIGPGVIPCDDSTGTSVDCINLDLWSGGVVLDDYGNLHRARMLSDIAIGDAEQIAIGFEEPTTRDGNEVFLVRNGTSTIVQYDVATAAVNTVTGLGTGAQSDPELSEDAQRLYYVQDGELWVASRACRL